MKEKLQEGLETPVRRPAAGAVASDCRPEPEAHSLSFIETIARGFSRGVPRRGTTRLFPETNGGRNSKAARAIADLIIKQLGMRN
jgi:hypothetical protein